VKGNGHSLILLLPRHLPEWSEEYRQHSQCLGRELKWALLLRPAISILSCIQTSATVTSRRFAGTFRERASAPTCCRLMYVLIQDRCYTFAWWTEFATRSVVAHHLIRISPPKNSDLLNCGPRQDITRVMTNWLASERNIHFDLDSAIVWKDKFPSWHRGRKRTRVL
jgi:hypothetical protein